MTFSFSIFLAMVVLLPGFALFAGLYATSGGVFRPVPPSPTPFTAITLVVMGACLGYLLGLAGVQLIRLLLAPFGRTLASPYAALIELAGGQPISEGALLRFILLTLIVMTVEAAVRMDAARAKGPRLARFFYGWLAEIVIEACPANRYVNAYVLCDIEQDQGFLGYEGTLDALNVSSDKEILSLLLTNARSFVIIIGRGGERRRPVLQTESIGRLPIARDRIINIAFDVYEREPG